MTSTYLLRAPLNESDDLFLQLSDLLLLQHYLLIVLIHLAGKFVDAGFVLVCWDCRRVHARLLLVDASHHEWSVRGRWEPGVAVPVLRTCAPCLGSLIAEIAHLRHLKLSMRGDLFLDEVDLLFKVRMLTLFLLNLCFELLDLKLDRVQLNQELGVLLRALFNVILGTGLILDSVDLECGN